MHELPLAYGEVYVTFTFYFLFLEVFIEKFIQKDSFLVCAKDSQDRRS